jgi:hypothetical protein
MTKPDPLWVHGQCDRILYTLIRWAWNYHKGKVSATGKYLTKPGELGPSPQEIDKPTRYANEIAWRKDDLECLTKILEAKVPDWPVTWDFRTNLPRWRNGIITKDGARVVTMDLYFQNLVEIIRLLEAMRDGKTKESREDLAGIDLSKY